MARATLRERFVRSALTCGSMVLAVAAGAQPVPQPFPRPSEPQSAPQQVPPSPVASAEPAPTEASLGIALYPNAQFLNSYDAGRGQRYYLFGTTSPYEQIVLYYRNILKQRGDVVFEEPPTHIFEIGRFREETMAFPPSVTVKDYTWGGTGGYLNPRLGAEPQRFATVIQIVPPPPTPPR